jgi:hypothetical protein
MRNRIFLGVALLALVAVSLITIVSPRGKPVRAAGQAASGAVYAFGSEAGKEIYVANGVKVLTSRPSRTPVFSPDGRYFLTSDASAVYLYDILTKHKYAKSLLYQPTCSSQSISNGYVYVADPGLVRYTLPGFTHGTPVATDLPRRPICTLGSVGNNALVVTENRKGWELYEVSPDGAARHVGDDPLWTPHQGFNQDVFVTTEHAANGDPSVAYDVFTNQGYLVHVLDLRTGASFQVDSAEVGLPLTGTGQADSLFVEDMWWGGDGHLYAIQSSYTIGNEEISAQQVWRLDGEAWVSWNSTPWVQDRLMKNGDSITVVAEPGYLHFPGAYWGDLYLRNSSGTRLIRKEANDIVIPAEEMGVPASTAAEIRGPVYFAAGQNPSNPRKALSSDLRPSVTYIAGDGSYAILKTRWMEWTTSRAVASGTATVQGISPAGGAGPMHDYPVVATFVNPVKVCGFYFWSEVKLHYPATVPAYYKQNQWWIFHLTLSQCPE